MTHIVESVKGWFQSLRTVVQSSKYQYKMLLIGETGSGKTSFLNLLCNCGTIQTTEFDKALDNFKEFNFATVENEVSKKMESKTSAATFYKVDLGRFEIGIIDTPGFGDSRGLDMDKENARLIVDAVKDQHYINCVCLTINGRQARMSATLKYVLTEVTSILPAQVLTNVIVVCTNTADPLDLNFDVGSLKEFFGSEIDGKRVFCIENPYCKFDKAKRQSGNISDEKIKRSLKKGFCETGEVFKEMCDVMKDFQQVHTRQFEVLYEKKQLVEREVIRLLLSYDNQKSIERAITEQEKKVQSALDTKTLNKGFRTTQKVQRWVQDKTSYHNTLCSITGCYSICHQHCGLPKSFNKEDFKYCAAMGGGSKCKICHHEYAAHHHDETLFKCEVEIVELIDHEMKKKFEDAKTMEDRAHMLKMEAKRKRAASERERSVITVQLLTTMDEFHDLGLNKNYAKLLENQQYMIKQRLEASDTQETGDLRKTLEEIEKKLKVVEETIAKQRKR